MTWTDSWLTRSEVPWNSFWFPDDWRAAIVERLARRPTCVNASLNELTKPRILILSRELTFVRSLSLPHGELRDKIKMNARAHECVEQPSEY
jgi:metal-sulfur cluster biosynthetic enzyme